jgi:hypothetical protein
MKPRARRKRLASLSSPPVWVYGPRRAFIRARNVAGPRIPSAVSPNKRWNRATAFVVAGPYWPSTFPVEKPTLASARWRTATCVPVSPGLSVEAGAGRCRVGGAVVVAVVGVIRVVRFGDDVEVRALAPPPLKTPPATSPAISSTSNRAPTATTRLSTSRTQNGREAASASLSQSSASGPTISSDGSPGALRSSGSGSANQSSWFGPSFTSPTVTPVGCQYSIRAPASRATRRSTRLAFRPF